MTTRRLELTRAQILAHRQTVGALAERLAPGADSLRRAAWAGLQDSVPRAALLSIHARVEGTEPSTWEDASLVQLWGPRFSAYVVTADDRGVFTLGRLPDDDRGRRFAEEVAVRLDAFLDGRRMSYGEAGRALGVHPNALRYAAPTGRVLIRWEGARQPTVWTVPPPEIDLGDARLELARRYLQSSAPRRPRHSASGRGSPGASPCGVRCPPRDVNAGANADRGCVDPGPRRADVPRPAGRPAAARLLPSGDAYFLLQGADRELLVPDSDHRRELWTPRVWPGGVLVGGELVGTWRRAEANVRIQPWRRLSRTERDAVESEAESLPLPGVHGRILAGWEDAAD